MTILRGYFIFILSFLVYHVGFSVYKIFNPFCMESVNSQTICVEYENNGQYERNTWRIKSCIFEKSFDSVSSCKTSLRTTIWICEIAHIYPNATTFTNKSTLNQNFDQRNELPTLQNLFDGNSLEIIIRFV